MINFNTKPSAHLVKDLSKEIDELSLIIKRSQYYAYVYSQAIRSELKEIDDKELDILLENHPELSYHLDLSDGKLERYLNKGK